VVFLTITRSEASDNVFTKFQKHLDEEKNLDERVEE